MKITKKITSIVLALLLAVSTVTGLAITANAASFSFDKPTSATLNIHKGDVDQVGDGSAQVSGDDKVIGNTDTLTGTDLDMPENFKALTDVQAQFAIYYVGDETTPVPSTANTVSYELKATVSTDKSTGVATFTADGTTNPLGLYYVEEVNFPDMVTYQVAQGFFVYLPMTAQNVKDTDTTSGSYSGTTWLSTVDVYPKNLTTLGGATLTKTINNAEITSSTPLAVAPKFKLVEYNANTEGAAIATDIEAKAGYNAVSKATGLDAKYDTVTIAQKDGKIAVDGLPVGTYAFIETGAAQIDAGTDLPIDSTPRVFKVSQGYNVDVTTSENGFGEITRITAGDTAKYSFSVDNSTEPTVSKAVDKAVAEIDEDVTWTITPTVPADIATYQKYVVTDRIADELDISGADAVTVTATGASLTKDTDYTIDVTDKLVTVDFTATGRALLANASNIKITIVTQINSNAVADFPIKNKAVLEYQNSFQTTSKTTESNEPETTTGALKIEKVDAADHDTKLAGVEFALTDSEGNAVNVTYDGTNKIYVVDSASSSNKVTTEADGTIYVKGLAYETYILTETKTNNGYQLLSAPIEIRVANGTGNNAVTVENVKQPDLPLTGGMGTILFTVAGLALIGGGAFFFIRSRKSRKEEK